MTAQLDLLDLIPREEVETKAPLHFTVDEYHPDEFDAAYEERAKRDTNFGIVFWSHQWHEGLTGFNTGPGHLHPSIVYGAKLGCERRGHQRDVCQCVKSDLHRIFCGSCEWWTPIVEDEKDAVHLHLDHCWPGWRELPVLESKMKPNGGYSWKIPDDYPSEWQVSGAPVRECRGQTKYGTRDVPAASPFGGYKTAVVRDCEVHQR